MKRKMAIPIASIGSIGKAVQEVYQRAGFHDVNDLMGYDIKNERRIEKAIDKLKLERAMDARYWERLLFRCMCIIYKVQCPDMAAPFPPCHLLCPLTLDIMCDPVCAPSGYTYEKSAIVEFIKRYCVDPVTRQPLIEGQLYPNNHAKEAAQHYLITALKYPF